MRTRLIALLVAATALVACLGPTDEPGPADDASVPGVVITNDEIPTSGLPHCEGLVDGRTPSLEVVVPISSEGEVAVVYEDDRAVCRDGVGTLYELGILTIKQLREVQRLIVPQSSGDPIPAHDMKDDLGSSKTMRSGGSAR